MDYHRAVELGCVGEGCLDLGDVVAVEGAQVVHAQGLEEGGGLEHLTQGGLGGADAPLDQLTHPREALGQVLQPTLAAHVGRVGADPDEVVRQTADRRSVGAAVVVQHDGDSEAAVAQVVQSLECHAPGHGAVADHGHHPTSLAGRGLGRSQAMGVGEHSRGVGVLDPVVGGFRARRVSRHQAGLAEAVESDVPAGE